MANKMNSEEKLRDELLSALVNAEETVPVPPDLLDGVMERIGPLPKRNTLAPYRAPGWLKWGIPGTILACMILLMAGNLHHLTETTGKLASMNNFFLRISASLSTFHPAVHLKNLTLPGMTPWILGGLLAMTGGFLLISWLLERKAGH
jgi:hypothetical protein